MLRLTAKGPLWTKMAKPCAECGKPEYDARQRDMPRVKDGSWFCSWRCYGQYNSEPES